MPHSQDSFYIALGPAVTGFLTSSSDIQNGVNVQGTTVGVYAECLANSPGLRRAPGGTGVYGQGDKFGVYGNAPQPLNVSTPASGIGVVGYSESNRAAVFQSGPGAGPSDPIEEAVGAADDVIAQMRLVPHRDDANPTLPVKGLQGDFYVITHSDAAAELWFCVQSYVESSAVPAQWRVVQLGALKYGGDSVMP
jgi:hypothetical protein